MPRGDIHRGFTWPLPSSVPVLFDVARRRLTAGRLTKRMAHRWWILDYSIGEGGLVRVGHQSSPWFNRPPLVAHLYAPGTPYWEDTRSLEGPQESAWVGFVDGDRAGLNRITRGGFRRFEDPRGMLRDRLVSLVAVGQSRGHEGFWRAQALFHEVLDLLLLAERNGPTSSVVRGERHGDSASELVRRVRAFLLSNYHEHLTLADIARAVNVAPSTLSHGYRAESGETPIDTLSRIRLGTAESMLLKGERLKTIASLTGYCDEFHLSKAFKQHRGVSPREFVRTAHLRVSGE
jgi:AraC-like DNA-binding protein